MPTQTPRLGLHSALRTPHPALPGADHPATAWLLGGVALLIAAAGAAPHAGGWNDGSRLAAVESLVDRGTLAIDDSVFVKPPQRLIDAGTPPYPPDRADLLTFGTFDKLFIDGHYHSDKPAVVSVLMAGAYKPLMWLGLPSPGDRPDVFCRVMTVLTAGLGYAVAVGCLWALGRRVGLLPGWRLAWVGSFALCTYAATYTQSVNTHTPQLAAVAGMCLLLLNVADAERAGRTAWGSLVGLGTLAGLGFNLDYGTGPALVAGVLGVVGWRTRRAGPVAVYLLAAAPWLAAAVGLNLAVGGGWKPPNMYPEYFLYPGSPFTEANLTGFLRHKPLNQLLYALGMWFGKHGFLNHNLPLLLAAAAGWRVLRAGPVSSPPPRWGRSANGVSRVGGESWAALPPAPVLRTAATSPTGGEVKAGAGGRAELVALLGWCAAAWLTYAALSNNMGGGCCSVRWFVPFLAPGYWLLAVLLRDRPEYRPDFLVLSVWGLVLAALMYWKGPWHGRMVPLLWPVVGAALLSWAAVAWRRRPDAAPAAGGAAGPGEPARRAA